MPHSAFSHFRIFIFSHLPNIAEIFTLRKKGVSYAAAIAWFFISVYLLTLPGTKFPKEDWLNKIWIDKWVHIFLFGVLTWLWCRAVTNKAKRIFVLVGLLCTLYGIGMEFVQRYCIAFRSFDGWDIVADAAGAVLGVWYSTRRYIKK